MVAVVEACLVTARRPIPADMLLVHERRRRLGLGSPSAPPTGSSDDEIVTADDDQIVEEPQPVQRTAVAAGVVVLRKPIALLSLAHIGWSGPIDHHALQSALACQPVVRSDATAYARLFGDQTVAADADAALEVTLQADDLMLLTAAAARTQPNALVRAARLGDRLVEAAVTASDVVSSVLAAYRTAALACAWYEQLDAPPGAQALRERDETAVTMLSTLRALLGER